MSLSGKIECSVLLHPLEVGSYLCDLAAGVSEGRLLVEDKVILMDEIRSFTVTVKPRGPNTKVKIKVKFPDARHEQTLSGPRSASPGRSFNGLKKRMQADFQDIRNALARGNMPVAAICRRFLEDARAMTSFPNMGDEYHLHFLDALQDFERSLDASDRTGLASSVSRLDQCRYDCHQRLR